MTDTTRTPAARALLEDAHGWPIRRSFRVACRAAQALEDAKRGCEVAFALMGEGFAVFSFGFERGCMVLELGLYEGQELDGFHGRVTARTIALMKERDLRPRNVVSVGSEEQEG
ncbi:MAG TPA: hypothetical protein VGI39_39720 [Polyangiaceae bacterium]|jgi:hypothetical protein